MCGDLGSVPFSRTCDLRQGNGTLVFSLRLVRFAVDSFRRENLWTYPPVLYWMWSRLLSSLWSRIPNLHRLVFGFSRRTVNAASFPLTPTSPTLESKYSLRRLEWPFYKGILTPDSLSEIFSRLSDHPFFFILIWICIGGSVDVYMFKYLSVYPFILVLCVGVAHPSSSMLYLLCAIWDNRSS